MHTLMPATGAVVNAVWDLWAKIEDKPLWKLLVDMTPEQIVACIDFRYITDVLTPDEALALLRRNESTKAVRIAEILDHGYPAYTTAAGWSGYSDDCNLHVSDWCRVDIDKKLSMR